MRNPLFRRKRAKGWRFAAATLCALGAFLVAGCAVEYDDWPPPGTEKSLRVGSALIRHDVAFAPGTAMPSAGELERLDAFLATLDTGYGDVVFVGAPRPGDPLAAERTARVLDALGRRGVEAASVSPAEADLAQALDLPGREDGRVSLRVRRHRVVLPDCPDWRKPTAADFSNTPSSNFGCATLVNLGRMVADPRDLVAGTPLSPASAERAALGIEAYRKGDQPALPDDSKSTTDAFPVAPMVGP